MTLELEGRIKTKLPAQGGTSARGAWTRQDFVVEYQDGSFPAEACFSAWGQERVDELARYNEGDAVKVSFNVRAREYGGRWYNDLRVWRLSAPGAQPQAAAPAPAAPAAARPAAPQPQAPAPSAPAPTIDDMPVDLGVGEDDLPF
ncbi:MAG: DUF3127 domain-containing protein [Bacteroidales bacterium]|nr:DUF3127 domain-containing protein [Bacteroidales bacterium]